MRERDDDDIKRFAVRESARQDTFKVVVIVVVILLLSNFLIVVYFVHPAFNPDDEGDVKEPDPEEDWLVATEPIDITEDEVWQDRDMVLDRPIAIKDNASLQIRDSHVKVYLEDLMFWLRPAFSVEPGCNLTLVNSTLEVYQDPRLEASVFGPLQRPDHNIPYLARVVNLVNAVDPVLHFDVQWLGNATQLAVGVLPSEGEELVLLEESGSDSEDPHSWTHVEVDLADYVGTQPWVVIWFNIYPEYPVLIGNLTVMDGDGWPQGDAFTTGHPQKDGWAGSRFTDLPYIQRTDFSRQNWQGLERTWQPLIEAEGNVGFIGSHVLEPPGMGRKAGSEFYKETLHPDQMRSVDQVGARGGHISVVGAALKIDKGSSLTNVPITGRDVLVMVVGTTLRGDHDLVSLHNASGGFVNCTFITDPLDPGHPFNSNNYRYLWALGVERTYFDEINTHMNVDFEVRDSEFLNNPIGIEVSYADVDIIRNTFRHISGMAVWNHESTGLSDWEDLRTSNSFQDMSRIVFLKTSATEVEFTHPEIAPENISVHSSASIYHGLDLYSPFGGKLRSHYVNRIRYIVPDLLVKHDGEVQRSTEIRTEVTWQNESERFSFPVGAETFTIDLSELFSEQPSETLLYAPIDIEKVGPGPTQDEYQLSILVDNLGGLRVVEPTMRFTIDGETTATVLLTESLVTIAGELFLDQNITLTPGWHDVNISIWGKEWLGDDNYSEEPVLVDSTSLWFLVLSQVNDIEPWMPLSADYILVPPGVTTSIDLGEPGEVTRESDTVFLLGWNGSKVRMDGSALEGRSRTRFVMYDNVSLELTNARFTYLQMTEDYWHNTEGAQGGPISLTNVSATIMGIDGLGRNINVSGIHATEYFGLDTAGRSNVTVTDSEFPDASVSITMWNGSLSMERCSFTSNWSRGLYIEPSGADVDVKDCTFESSFLMLFFNNFYWWVMDNLNVTDCQFNGEDAVLYVGWDLLNVDFYDVDPDFVPQMNGTIANNTFSGPGCHIVLHHGTFGQLLGDNDLRDGARLYAFYITRLQVIPPDGTPFWGAYDFVPTEGVIADWSFDIARWIEMDGELMVDVTDDLSVENDPPILDVILYSKYGSYRIVRGFSQVVPNADNDEVTYPVYPSFHEILKENLLYWPPLEGGE